MPFGAMLAAIPRFHQRGGEICGTLGGARSYGLCPGAHLVIGNFAPRKAIDERADFVRREFVSIALAFDQVGMCILRSFVGIAGFRVGSRARLVCWLESPASRWRTALQRASRGNGPALRDLAGSES